MNYEELVANVKKAVKMAKVSKTSADTIMQMIEGKLQPRVAYTKELLRVHGDVELLSMLPFGRK